MTRTLTILGLLTLAGFSVSPTAAQQPKKEPPARLVSPEVHADKKVTFRINAPKATEVTVRGDWTAGPPENIRGLVNASPGTIQHVVSQSNPETAGWRLSFELAPGRESASELRAQLVVGEAMLSEVWLYRWTA